MKLLKKAVDERQELELLKIEHFCFWVVFWGLCISIVVQVMFMDASFSQFAAEWIILMIICIGMTVGCVKKGQWDYFTKPTMKTYIVTGVIGATVFSLVFAIAKYTEYEYFRNDLKELLVTTIILFICMFAAIFVATAVVGKLVNKKREKLDKEYSDNE